MNADEADHKTNLPTISDGWDDTEGSDSIIQGTLARCVDGHWSDKDGGVLPKQMLALTTMTVLQHWQDQKPIETILKRPGKPLPDLDELNAKIPQSQWENGIDGKPRPPWQKQYIVYLLDPSSAAKFTYANGTTGARIAVENLKDQVKWMRALRGNNVTPLVELSTKPMKTKFGQKLRPEFKIVRWIELGGGGAPVPVPQLPPATEYATAPDTNKYAELKMRHVKAPTTEEALDDSIPF
jgi:hypothetical protein